MIKRVLYFGNPAYLSCSDKQMVIRIPASPASGLVSESSADVVNRTAPIEDIGFLVLDNPRITITSNLLQELMDNTCAVIGCNEKHMPSSLMLPMEGNTLYSERVRRQINAPLPLRKQMWQQTVKAKIQNQEAVLRSRGIETGNMRNWAKDVRSNDSTNLEARAAAYYWKSLFPELRHFNRDNDDFFANALLNYGYAILRSIIARALITTGLLVTFGIHHHNKYNAYCLADDIMEPYRPYVDKLVLGLLAKHPDVEELTTPIKKELLSIPHMDVMLCGRSKPLMIAAAQTCTSLWNCLAGKATSLDYPAL